MSEYAEILNLATKMDMPSAFISAVWAYAKSLQDSVRTQELAVDLPEKATP